MLAVGILVVALDRVVGLIEVFILKGRCFGRYFGELAAGLVRVHDLVAGLINALDLVIRLVDTLDLVVGLVGALIDLVILLVGSLILSRRYFRFTGYQRRGISKQVEKL